jgi:hypothetical protein
MDPCYRKAGGGPGQTRARLTNDRPALGSPLQFSLLGKRESRGFIVSVCVCADLCSPNQMIKYRKPGDILNLRQWHAMRIVFRSILLVVKLREAALWQICSLWHATVALSRWFAVPRAPRTSILLRGSIAERLFRGMPAKMEAC